MVTWPLLKSRLVLFILYSLRKEYATKDTGSQANRPARADEARKPCEISKVTLFLPGPPRRKGGAPRGAPRAVFGPHDPPGTWKRARPVHDEEELRRPPSG